MRLTTKNILEKLHAQKINRKVPPNQLCSEPCSQLHSAHASGAKQRSGFHAEDEAGAFTQMRGIKNTAFQVHAQDMDRICHFFPSDSQQSSRNLMFNLSSRVEGGKRKQTSKKRSKLYLTTII
jgi:hypothetical protein